MGNKVPACIRSRGRDGVGGKRDCLQQQVHTKLLGQVLAWRAGEPPFHTVAATKKIDRGAVMQGHSQNVSPSYGVVQRIQPKDRSTVSGREGTVVTQTNRSCG